ncbi:MAG: T9SS type A sorting domain-containing protein [Bacteroidetes bacterium]|nr:T9SS type A sorting domain-containing protein [Bacteroidota bacterium]
MQVTAQFVSDGRKITGSLDVPVAKNPGTRSASKPQACKSDTSMFPRYGTTGYYTLTIRNGSSLGQFYGANQNMTVSGFTFYGYALTPTPVRNVNIRVRCNLYKAGADSLPSGTPLASDTITLDTVQGSNILLSRITRMAVFKKPVTLNYPYILVVECDSTAVSGVVVTNNWVNKDGKKKNIGCGSVSGKWYRCLQLNISGVQFDADMQYYPYVKYDFGTDFTITNQCYNGLDTVRFQNAWKNNVSSQAYYNYYIYYNLPQFSHRWNYDGNGDYYTVEGKYKPTSRKNFNVRLISTVYSYMSGQCQDTTTKTVYFKPDKPTLKKPARACRGDSTTVDIVANSGTTVKWFKNPADTGAFFTGTSYKIKNAQKNDTFYVRVDNVSCQSPMVRIDFTVYDYPSDPVVRNDSICKGAVANLQAKTNLGNLEWFDDVAGGTLRYSGSDIQTGKLASDSFYYVQANNSGCLNKSGRIKVGAYVSNSFAPSSPVITADTSGCYSSGQSFTLRASHSDPADTLRWYDVSVGGKPIAKGDSFAFTPGGRNDYQYFVETWNGVCGSGRSSSTVHILAAPDVYGATGDTICPGDSARPYLSVPWGAAHWHLTATDNTPVFTGKRPAFGGLNGNQNYFIRTSEGICQGGGTDSVRILVNTPPAPTSATANSVCAKAPGVFEVKVPYGAVNWYEDSVTTTPLLTGSLYNYGMMLSNVTLYYETTYKGCASKRKPLTVVIKPRPTAGFTWALQWQNRLVCTPISTTNTTFQWYWGDGQNSSGLPGAHQYAAKGSYTVKQVATSTANGCKDTADIPVLVDHTNVKTWSGAHFKLYPIPVQAGELLHFPGWAGQNVQVKLYTTAGQLVSGGASLNGQYAIPSHLVAGNYIVVLENSGDKVHEVIRIYRP